MFGFGKKSGPTLGLDINSSTISVIQIEKTKTDTKVSRFSSMPTPPDIVREGLLADPEAVGTAVRELLDLVGIPDKKPIPLVNIGIPGQAVVIRLMPVPTGMPNEELTDVVRQEAINNLPFPLEEANIDYCLLPATERTDPDGVKRVDVLLAAIQRIVVDSYWRMAETANVKLGHLDISSLSVIRSLAAAGALTEDGKMTMAVNIRNDATDITLIEKGMPHFSRSVLLGVETLGEAISRSIDAPMDEAIALLPKIQLGSVPTSDPKLGQAAQVARSVFGDLTAEVGRSLEFYMSQAGAVQVEQVILTGPGCVVPGIGDFIANRLNIPTTIADPFTNLIYDKAQIIDERRATHAMLVGLVTDTAASPIKTVAVDLNKQGRTVLPTGEGEEGEEGVEEEEVDTPWFVPAVAAGVALALLATIGWAALQFYFSSNKDTELSQLEQSVSEQKSQIEKMTKSQEEITHLREKRDVLDRIVKHGQPRSVALQMLRDTIPQGVQITNMTVGETNISANCVGVDFAKASHYAINMEGTNLVDDVRLGDVHRIKNNPSAVAFHIDTTVKPDVAKMSLENYTPASVPAGGGTPVAAKPKLIYFTMKNNAACQKFEQLIDSSKGQMADKCDVQAVDIDDPGSKDLVAQYQVSKSSLPDCVVLDANGKVTTHLHGGIDQKQLTTALTSLSSVAQSGSTK